VMDSPRSKITKSLPPSTLLEHLDKGNQI
jgi:hypothetical protein